MLQSGPGDVDASAIGYPPVSSLSGMTDRLSDRSCQGGAGCARDRADEQPGENKRDTCGLDLFNNIGRLYEIGWSVRRVGTPAHGGPTVMSDISRRCQ